MDLRNGNIFLQEARDFTDIITVIDGSDGFILDIGRRRDLQTDFPNELTPSETHGVMKALDTQLEPRRGRSSSTAEAERKNALKTLSNIAAIGLRANAQLGSMTELVQRLVEEIRRPETPGVEDTPAPTAD